MPNNLFIQLIARLNKSLSKAQIQTDLKDIEKTPFYVRLIGRLNKSLTRRNIENDVQNAARNISVDVNARVSERELQQSFDVARQNLENRIQNDPINVPVSVDTEGIEQGQQQIHNLNNEARNSRSIFSEYLNAREIFRAVTNAIKEAVNEVKELNKAQTDLQIVTGKSNAEMVSLMNKYNELAKDMSVTTKNVASSADEWLRQGKSVAETDELIKDSVILAKVGQIDAADATKYLTSAMNGFKTETSDVIGIVDKLTGVDLESATSAGGLAEAMSKCANSADVAGVSMDALIGYISTVAEVTQKSDSVVGESFNTILARMGKIKLNNWIDEDGKDISGEINDVEKTLAQFDIKLRNSATEFRNFEDVIYDVGMAWDKFSSVDQNAIANAFGGVYQRENVIALFENFNRALELSEISANSAGTAYQKFEIYENSLEAATNRLTAAFEELAYNTIDSKFLTGLTNATAGIVEFVDNTKLIQTGLTATLFTGVISGLVALGARMIVVKNNVAQFTQAMNLSRSSTAIVGAQYDALRNSVRGLTEAQLRLVLSSRQLTETQRLDLMQSAGIEQSRQRQLLQTWNLTNATNAQTSATFSLRGAWEGLKASIATNPIGLIVTALTLATTAVTAYKQKQEEIRQEALDSANALDDQAKALDDLKKKYEDICNSTDDEKTKNEQLNEIKQELIDTYKIEKDRLADLNLEREKGLALLEQTIDLKNYDERGNWLGTNKNAFEKAKNKIKYPEYNRKTDGVVEFDLFNPINKDEVRDSVKDLFKYISDEGNTKFTIAGKTLIEKYDNLQKVITKLGNSQNLTADEEKLLDALNKESKNIKSVLDEYQDTYLTGYKYSAENNLFEYINTAPIENLGKENYLAWRDGLLATADGDKQLENELLALAEKQFPDYAEYFNNLDLAKSMFGVSGNINNGFDAGKKKFLEELSDEDLKIAVNIPDLFTDGLDGASKKIQEFKADPNNSIAPSFDYSTYSEQVDTVVKNLDKVQSAIDKLNEGKGIDGKDITELANTFPEYSSEILSASDNTEKLKAVLKDIKSDTPKSLINTLTNLKDLSEQDQEAVNGLITILSKFGGASASYSDMLAELETRESMLSTAYKEMHDDGVLSIATYQKLAESGIDYSDAISIVNGKITANIQSLKELTKEKYQNEIATLRLKKAEIGWNIAANPEKYSEYAEQIRVVNEELANLEGITNLYDAFDYTTTAKKDKDEKPERVLAFEEELAKREHEINMGLREEDDAYYDWLLSAAHTAYDGLKDYQDELWKHEETVYKWRKDKEQELFDEKIENMKTLADKALDSKNVYTELSKEQKELADFNKKMQSEFGLGNVDLTKRPKVDMDDGSTATVLSSSEFLWQGDEENGHYVAVHYTPILPDGTVLDDDTLAKYLYETLEGSDDILKADTKGIVLKVDAGLNITDEDIASLETGNYTENIQNIIKECDDWDVALHNIQEEWLKVSEAAENSTSVTLTRFEYARNQITSAISEIQKRINDIQEGRLAGNADDIKSLNDELTDLRETLADINKDELEYELDNEKAYWEDLKSKQEDIYDKEIDKLEKVKDAISKKNEEEEKATDLAEKQLALEKAKLELEKARQNRSVMLVTKQGTFYTADQSAIDEAEKNVKDAEKDIADAKKDDVTDKISEQIDVLKEQKENTQNYYDTIIKLLEDSQNDPLQAEANRDLWGKILATENGQNAIASADQDQVNKLIENGFLAFNDGKYSLNNPDAEVPKDSQPITKSDITDVLTTVFGKKEGYTPEKIASIAEKFEEKTHLLYDGFTPSDVVNKATENINKTINNSQVINKVQNMNTTYHIDKVEVGYSGNDFEGLLADTLDSISQQIIIDGNKALHGR